MVTSNSEIMKKHSQTNICTKKIWKNNQRNKPQLGNFFDKNEDMLIEPPIRGKLPLNIALSKVYPKKSLSKIFTKVPNCSGSLVEQAAQNSWHVTWSSTFCREAVFFRKKHHTSLEETYPDAQCMVYLPTFG